MISPGGTRIAIDKSNALSRRWTKEEDSLFNCSFEQTSTTVPENKYFKIRPKVKRRKWTNQEDELLRLCYALHREEWLVIAEHMQERSPRSCRERWKIINANWNQKEIKKLEENIEKYGEDWKQVVKGLP
ncbi:4418_t:CDS:2, partial [Paraglomus brasilianum]